MNTTIALLATLPAIIALVNGLKTFGLTGKWSLLAAVVLGGSLSVTDLMFGSNPIYAAGVNGVLLGLAAAGVYDLAGPSAKTTTNIVVKTPSVK